MSAPHITKRKKDRRHGVWRDEPRFMMKFKRQTMASRIRAQAALITSQEQIDNILKQVPKDIGDAWLEMFGPHLHFTPRQLQVEPVQPGREVSVE